MKTAHEPSDSRAPGPGAKQWGGAGALLACLAALASGCDAPTPPQAAAPPAQPAPQAQQPAGAAATPVRFFTDGVTRGSWVGALAPELKLEQVVQGPPTPPTLAALQGKVAVVAFWSTNCPTCPVVLPHLSELAAAFKSEPVAFVSVLNEPESVVREFLKTNKVDTTVALDADMSTTNEWFIPGVPMAAIVNQHGVLVAKTHPKNVTPEAIRAALEGRAPNVPLPPTPDAYLDKAPPAHLAILETMIRPADAAAPWSRTVVGGARLRAHTLREIVGFAWRVDPQLVASDSLVLDAKYDVTVSPPEGREMDAYALMQRLLAESFQLEARTEKRAVEAFILKPAAQGPKLERAAMGRAGGQVDPDAGRITLKNSPMASLVSALYFALGAETPVVDESGAQGNFDVTLTWKPGDRDSLIAAARDQLGLDLAPAKRELGMLVVERDVK